MNYLQYGQSMTLNIFWNLLHCVHLKSETELEIKIVKISQQNPKYHQIMFWVVYGMVTAFYLKKKEY